MYIETVPSEYGSYVTASLTTTKYIINQLIATRLQ
jgi:hypothetical protein